MEYYIMNKANQFYREAMAKHGLANAVSPMIEDIVLMIVEKMEKEHEADVRIYQEERRKFLGKIEHLEHLLAQKNKKEPDFEMVAETNKPPKQPTMDDIRHLTSFVPYAEAEVTVKV